MHTVMSCSLVTFGEWVASRRKSVRRDPSGRETRRSFLGFESSYGHYDLGTATFQVKGYGGDPRGCRRPVLGALQVQGVEPIVRRSKSVVSR